MALAFGWSLLVLVSLPFGSLAQSGQEFNPTPESPCPKILQYVTNGKIWFGEIKFSASSYGSQILLEVKMTVDSQLNSEYVGRIELMGSQQEILSILSSGQKLKYRVYFPLTNPLPKFTSIKVNDKKICSGPPGNGDFVTTISLEHRFNSGIMPLLNDQVDNNYFANDNEPYLSTESFQIKTRPTSSKTRTTPISAVTESYTPTVECGIAPKKTNALILGGEETNPGDWPWLTAMFRKKATGLDFICSGSLISNYHVITAAHCVNERNRGTTQPENLIVKVGAHNLQDWADANAKIINVRQIYSHPNFNRTNLANDIAILLLDVVTYNERIKPVCVWRQQSDQNLVVGKTGTVLGWGRDENGVLVSPTPKESKMPIVSLETCRASNPDFFLFTSESTLCAGKRDGTGPCNGDSGGGLFLFENGRWSIRGIVSNSLVDRKIVSGEPCTLRDYVIFTDAAQFTTWITNTIGSR